MNRDRLEGNWIQFRGRIKALWGNLANDPRAATDGARDLYFGRLQERHGAAQDDAAKQLRDFLRRNRNWDLNQ